jgi:hypothetical protein
MATSYCSFIGLPAPFGFNVFNDYTGATGTAPDPLVPFGRFSRNIPIDYSPNGVHTLHMELAVKRRQENRWGAVAPDDRRHPEVRRRMSGPAMRTFFNVAAAWELTAEEQRALLGWPAESTFFKYKAGLVATLPYDMLIRISLVLGVYKSLHVLYPEPDLANRWVKLPNSHAMFGGKPALLLMIHGGMDGLYQVRRLLDGRCGGN